MSDVCFVVYCLCFFAVGLLLLSYFFVCFCRIYVVLCLCVLDLCVFLCVISACACVRVLFVVGLLLEFFNPLTCVL